MRPALRQVLFGSGAINLNSFTAGQSDGVWYDFTKTGRQFTTSTGPTNVAAAGDTIGLDLDQRTWNGQTLTQVLAGQSEFCSNPGGPFVNTTGYSVFASTGTAPTLSVVSGRLRITGAADTQFGKAVIAIPGLIVGKTYRLTGTASNGTGSAFWRITNSSSGISSSATDYTGTAANMFFVAAATTMYLALINNTATGSTFVEFDAASVKLIPGYPATQSTSSLCAKWQTGGWARYDGIDDYHSQGFKVGSAGLILIRNKLIQKTAATQIMIGAVGAGGTDRIYFGYDTSGYAVGRIGNGAAMSVSADRTGTDGTVGVLWDATTASLVIDGASVVSQSQSGAPTTSVAPIIGGYSNNGTPGSYCNFDARSIVAIPTAPNAATIRNIHNAMMTA